MGVADTNNSASGRAATRRSARQSTKSVRGTKRASPDAESEFRIEDVTTETRRKKSCTGSWRPAPVMPTEDEPEYTFDGYPVKRRTDSHEPIVKSEDGFEGANDVKKPKLRKKPEISGEKRLRRFRNAPPQSYMEIKGRAMSQRMFVINRTRTGLEDCPEEVVDIAGTTGNIYHVHISQVPSCTCPHAKKGNQCKHIIYVLTRVLKAPDNLQYQLAFLKTELCEIFANAPAIPSADSVPGNDRRKPIEDDCPICCMAFEPDSEEIVYCKAACGNNIHKECFEQWAASRRNNGSDITCPFCRSPWAGADEMEIRKVATQGQTNEEGYVNIATELGISRRRDYSTYHPFWVRKQQRNGVDLGDWEDPYDSE